MAFDTTARNRLAKLVGDLRTLLTNEFSEQCQGLFGIEASGRLTDVKHLGHLDEAQRATAILLRERIEYLAHSHPEATGAAQGPVTQLVREQAFTVLNRLAALRMAEKRNLVAESVGSGYQSKGFKVFESVARTGLQATYDRYRQYLLCLFDELALDLGVLFDRRSPQGMLFPREVALLECFHLLNSPELDGLWAEDETIGWVYQDYNDPAERKEMREAPAPRNSRELAVRNQFFTPRYVVEFLTDNTIGRIWYEMTSGRSRLKDACHYLVRRPAEIFLEPGAAEHPAHHAVVGSQLLLQPAHIPHRPLKDPREIRMLDPACGSMHFGLYAFDLFEIIYDEAWDIARDGSETQTASPAFSPFVSFVGRYADKAAFLLDVPHLIIEHNLHGIDIDPRAAQIAGLSLWLRAQRTWQQHEIAPQDRPRIRRSNIVCAEPMPGDATALEEFIEKQLATVPERKLLGQLVRRVFEGMKLAGEAGSLLQIEEEVARAVAEARQKWIAAPKPEQGRLFRDDKAAALKQGLDLDVTGVTDEAFWGSSEEQIYGALQAYAEQAEQGGTYQRRLFADDAARGFAFIDLCRRRYDVVLMNPPFGAFPVAADSILNERFPNCRGDLYPSFIERWNVRADLLGAITNRTGLSLKGLEEWRRNNLLGERSLALLADLGMNVLDALVEVAIYVIGATSSDLLIAFDCLDVPAPRISARVLDGVEGIRNGTATDFIFFVDKGGLSKLPTAPVSYRAPISIVHAFDRFAPIERGGLKFRVTSPNYDDFRYLRLKWEVPPSEVGRKHRWSPVAKGGEYSPYCADLDLVIDWDDEAESFRGFLGTPHRPLTRPACADLFFTGGLTWSERTASRFSPRILPPGAIFSSVGPYCGGLDQGEMLTVLGVLMSAPFQGFLELFLAAGDATSSGSAARHYQVGALRSLPVPDIPEDEKSLIRHAVKLLVSQRQRTASAEESNSLFSSSPFAVRGASLGDASKLRSETVRSDIEQALLLSSQVDALISKLYGIDEAGAKYLETLFGKHPIEYPICSDLPAAAEDLVVRPVDEIIRAAVEAGRTGRHITVKSFYADRKLEVLSHYLQVSALSILPIYTERCIHSESAAAAGESVASYILGCAFGRWDVQYATGDKAVPELPAPFAPLPICPPGQLQNSLGLPACAEDVPAAYPLRIPWGGILVDDPNHPLDIQRRMREVIAIIWKGQAEAIEQEVCGILGVESLHGYFSKATGFFADHLKRYSESRRQAPIYWPLSTSSGSYTLWVYYLRLTDQTLHIALADFVDPKIRGIERSLTDARSAGRSAEVEKLANLLAELQEFRADLERVIRLPWKPNLNDGVMITASPLWKLFRLPKWQKDLKACWQELSSDDYDWAHLALSIWPDRVKATCRKDRSIAIAHGLEHLFQEPAPVQKAARGRRIRKTGVSQ